MKWIKTFNEKKEEKEKDQETLFTAKSLVDDQKPSFTTDTEDQESIRKEFDKNIDKIEKDK